MTTSPSNLATFEQLLCGPVWDGDLISKAQCDLLKEAGFIDHGYGFNYLATKGIEAAIALGYIQRGGMAVPQDGKAISEARFAV